MSYIKGHIEPIWNQDFKNLEYEKQPVSNKEIETWRSQGYNHSSFTGMMHGSKNPMPDWVNTVAAQLELKNCGFVFYKMQTNDIMPTHVDHFSRYCEIFDVQRENVLRAVVFLEDWKIGHYFDIGGEAIVNYSAGDWIIWSCDEPHFAANIGTEDRYTLQITGVL